MRRAEKWRRDLPNVTFSPSSPILPKQQIQTMLRIKVNGEEHSIDAGASVADLLQKLEKNPKFLAIERNRELVPRTEHANCELQDGDEIEIVTLVGGG